MMIILEGILLVFLVVTATITVCFRNILNSVLAFSIFSIVLSILYLVYQAPDVSLAEAVIGAGINTAIFITAISQVRRDND
ncbi:putative multicomponent Na+:H+ antiporter subunit B [Halothermothrix orenii H 168]|uniref:Putative multicomponent Na+:H+ antiporter subunit B n=2 Tax=Halothermothrix orenii TaxID=31909 RepID=B8CXE0_HALOH|nr:putative multicomponent Na+:H+ antiporter subunit B [Halothermothrix orenii H 168]